MQRCDCGKSAPCLIAFSTNLDLAKGWLKKLNHWRGPVPRVDEYVTFSFSKCERMGPHEELREFVANFQLQVCGVSYDTDGSAQVELTFPQVFQDFIEWEKYFKRHTFC